MRLGGTLCFSNSSEYEEKLAASGFRAITAPFSSDTPREDIDRLCRITADLDVTIAEVGVWRNPFDPKEGAANLAYAKRQLRLADDLGIPCCVNIAGTVSEAGWDAADKCNFTREMYDRIVSSLREIIDDVKPRTAYYTLEPMPWMIPDGPDVYLQLIRDVDRPRFAAHMDFVNMICTPRRYLKSAAFIEECFQKLAPFIKSTHIKDSSMDLNRLTSFFAECSPGEGGLDYAAVLRIIDRYLPKDAPVLLEHMQTFEEYAAAYDYVAGKAREAGVEIA